MNGTINRIMELAGPMPDPAAHRRYLASLPTGRLEQRLKDLQAEQDRPLTQPRVHWRGGKFYEPARAQ